VLLLEPMLVLQSALPVILLPPDCAVTAQSLIGAQLANQETFLQLLPVFALLTLEPKTLPALQLKDQPTLIAIHVMPPNSERLNKLLTLLVL
jgi:hypothetical protein